MSGFSKEVKVIDAEVIVVKYADGSEKEIKKGAVITRGEENKKTTLNMEFVKMSGEELIMMIYVSLEMGSDMGMFNVLD